MLRRLEIEDYGLIARADVEFADGATIFTGETGSGKTMLLGALEFALGARTGSDVVRRGARKASVTVTFEPDEAMRARLAEDGFSLDDGESGQHRARSERIGALDAAHQRARIGSGVRARYRRRDRRNRRPARGATTALAELSSRAARSLRRRESFAARRAGCRRARAARGSGAKPSRSSRTRKIPRANVTKTRHLRSAKSTAAKLEPGEVERLNERRGVPRQRRADRDGAQRGPRGSRRGRARRDCVARCGERRVIGGREVCRRFARNGRTRGDASRRSRRSFLRRGARVGNGRVRSVGTRSGQRPARAIGTSAA